MNTLIETLAKQAGMVKYPTGLGISENTLWGDRNIEKFAKLIVQECAEWCGHDPSGTAAMLHAFGIGERDVPIISADDRALFAGIGSSESFTVNGTKKAFGVKG
jgi:hypothetical protein